MTGWEPFTSKSERKGWREPVIRLASTHKRTEGKLYVTAAAWDLIGNPEYVRLLFDAERRRIGIQATPAMYLHAYKVNPQIRAVTATAFFRIHDLYRYSGQRLTAYLDGDILAADLPADEGVES